MGVTDMVMRFVVKPVVAVVAFIALVVCAYRMMIKHYFRNFRDQSVVSYDYMKDTFINSVSQDNHYMNYGLWMDATKSLMEANTNLVEFAFNKSGLQHKKHTTVLDVGCGYGEQDIQWIKRMDDSCTIHAIDISEAQIKHAIERNRHVNDSHNDNRGRDGNLVFEVCDVKNIGLKYSHRAFDVIFSIESAFHYPNRKQFFEHANDLLTPDGRFIITDIMLQTEYSENSWNNKLFMYFFSDFFHIPAQNLISAEEWDKQLASAFVVEEVIDVTEKTFGPYYMHFMHTYIKNKKLPQFVGSALGSFFCNNQPFAYKIAICKKKMINDDERPDA
jgi:cyclopropane fatty-acyl-phospholipid synthase-like methyltransferase